MHHSYNVVGLRKGSVYSSVVRELSLNELFGLIIAVGNSEYG